MPPRLAIDNRSGRRRNLWYVQGLRRVPYTCPVHALDHRRAGSRRTSTRICLQLLIESQYRHGLSPLLQTLRQVDDGDVRKGVSHRGCFRKTSRQINKVLRSQQDVVIAQGRYNRPRCFFRQRANDVVAVLFDELAASISVANMHDVVGYLEQHWNGYEHSSLCCAFRLFDNVPMPFLFRVAGYLVQLKQPRGVEDGDVRHDTDSIQCRIAFCRFLL